MLVWKEFTTIAREAAAGFCSKDSRLTAILATDHPLGERTDAMGRHFPESVGIYQHPDTTNLQRALGVRRELANSSNNYGYVAYVDSVLAFLKTIPVDKALFIVIIATDNGTYEAFYAPQLRKVLISEIGTLETH